MMFQRIREDIHCVFDRDPAARNTLEVLTAYPGIHAVIMHRMNHALWCRGFRLTARFLSHIARWLTGIEIHPGATIGRRFFIDHGMGVVIGETAEIGNDCTLYHGVTLGGTSWEKGKRHPTLGKDVVVGAGAKILGPHYIGDSARIGSNSVVLNDVSPGATVVGIPGRVIPPKEDATNQKRQEIAKKIGFDAYGTTRDMPDPVANAINSILDHMHVLDKRVEDTCHELRRRGINVDDSDVPEIEPENIEAIAPQQKLK